MLAKDIDEVIDLLSQIIDEERDNNSPNGYFPALYRKVTIEVKEKIAEGYFEDGPRMEKLDVVFANRYLEAYYAFKNGEPLTMSWKLAFQAGLKGKPIVLQHLFLGMSAHINLDLGIAAAQVSRQADIEALKNDFNKINEILSSLVNEVQAQLSRILPLLKLVDKMAGRWDEALADFSMDIARKGAWQVAQDLSEIGKEDLQAHYIDTQDFRVHKFGNRIYKPGFWLSILLTIIRWLERGDVSKRIDWLRT